MPAQSQRANPIKAFLRLERDSIDAGGGADNSDGTGVRLPVGRETGRTEVGDYG